MMTFHDFFIINMILIVVAGIEQICFTVFAQYPYRYGITIAKYVFAPSGLDNSIIIHDQLRFIEQLLKDSDDYECKVRPEEIYIRRKHKYFSSGIRYIGAAVFFKDGWNISIRSGILVFFIAVYVFVVFCVGGSPPAMVIAACVLLTVIGSQIAEYFKLRRFLSSRLGTLKGRKVKNKG